MTHRHRGLIVLSLIALLALPTVRAFALAPLQFEGLAMTDFSGADATAPPNPDVAVGPDDLLLGARTMLVRLPNPHAVGRSASTNVTTQQVSLDAWIGETALGQLCPTQPRTAASCILDNLSVRYDQLQGRFLVLFTVVNTGIDSNGFLTQPRKASWVLLVSRAASLTTRAGVPAGAEVFVAPGAVSGINAAVWSLFYGSATNGIGADGFGNPAGPGAVGAGNLNALPGIANAPNPSIFDCRPSAVAASGVSPSQVCYLPTSAHLGIDNDAITIVSAVINDNINRFDRGPSPASPAYAGNRVRVIKKTALYTLPTASRALVAGNQFAATDATRIAADYYDLYTTSDVAGDPVPADPALPFTVVSSFGPSYNSSPIFYEPAHLRGRALATFANCPTKDSGGHSRSQTHLVGAQAIPFGTSPLPFNAAEFILIQPIQHLQAAAASPPVQGPVPFYAALPVVQGAPVPRNTDPGLVDQAPLHNQSVAPKLYVGDNRPARVIFREGHLYDARTAAAVNQFTFSGAPLSSTVFHDVIQMPGATATPLALIDTHWQDARAYAPMFDVPASVAQSGPISPVNVAAYLDKLFVGTTSVPLLPDRSRGRDTRYREVETGAAIPVDRCADAGSSTADGLAWPSLFDVRCGEDAFDSTTTVLNPATGVLETKVFFSRHGGASTDPDDLSLWVVGAYARLRGALTPTGRWGTYVADYPLRMPATDEYGNDTQIYDDVPPPKSKIPGLFLYAQIARQLGLGPAGLVFGVKDKVTRAEGARLVVLSQMDEAEITDYLTSTPGGATTSSFADVTVGTPDYRYIETMARRGYDVGCGSGNYCPAANLTRAQLATAVVRAKLGNVFPAAIVGCPPDQPIATCSVANDNFGLYVPTEDYYADNLNVATNPAYPYIQVWGQLRIDQDGVKKKDGLKGKFKGTGPVTRPQLVGALIRAFFS